MKKTLAAAVLALASFAAHADQFAVQVGQFATQAKAQVYVMALVKNGVPAFAETKGDRVLLRAGPFATRDQAQAALVQISAAHLENVSVPSARVPAASPAPTLTRAPATTTEAAASAPSGNAASKPAIDFVALAKKMDSEWQIYDTRERRCVVLDVFMGKVGGDINVKTPEQFAAAYGNDAVVHYVDGGEAATVDASDVTFMLAHGTQTCNEIADAQHARGH
jgi:hypothetical protein